MRRYLAIVVLLLTALTLPAQPTNLVLPLKPNSVRFAVIGDMGTGSRDQYVTAARMAELHQRFPFDFVIMVGDNIYGSSGPSDMEKKFSMPYKPLLDAGVKFYAALGNHDSPNERFYAMFNMNGQAYFTFKQSNVRFFVLDSNYMDPKQQEWLAKELQASGSQWKIAYFHHPLYSSGSAHGSTVELRNLLEPLFRTYGVRVVFSGHDHNYERVKPQYGIHYFTEGSSGKLMAGNLKKTSFTETGNDTENTFMLVEIAGDEMYFQTISQSGGTVDSGMIPRTDEMRAAEKPAAPTTAAPKQDELAQPPKTSVPQGTPPTTESKPIAKAPAKTATSGTQLAAAKPSTGKVVPAKAKTHRKKKTTTLRAKAPAPKTRTVIAAAM